MRERAPFQAEDLDELDERFLSQATAVVAMQEVYAGNRAPSVIGLRHDMDAGHALETGVRMAEWEAERGYRSTYYVLHTSPYWENSPTFWRALERIAILGHEIGIHSDALAEALKTGGDPDLILWHALEVLRVHGFTVRGVAGHGNALCNRDRGPGEPSFANDEQFVECARPKEGEPDRELWRGNVRLKLAPRPLADFGLDYEALILGGQYPFRFSDSGGVWLNPGFEEAADQFAVSSRGTPQAGEHHPREYRQLHFLWHPDWWNAAFSRVKVAA